MSEKSKGYNIKPDYNVLIPEYKDEEILSILRKRNYYQKEAADLAVKEAIKRGLIYSEQDLFSSEFNNISLKTSLFPEIEDVQTRKRIRKSISRSMLLAGIMPTVWGMLKLNQGNYLEGILLILGGMLWIYFTSMLIRAYQKHSIIALFVLLFFAVLYMYLAFSKIHSLEIMDFFIPGVLFSLILYGILFLYRLKS